jgi:oxygen-independent coproporphyrinogen-3 oxidase
LVAAGSLVPMDQDEQAELYEFTQETLAAAGLAAYEVSNHARPGEECRHNLVYWRYGDYVGIGPGAHGRLTLPEGRMATRTERVPERWLAKVDQTGTGELEREPLSRREQTVEMLMMGLRLSEGVEEERLGRAGGGPMETLLDRRGFDRALEGGWLRRECGRLIATPSGRQSLDHLLRLLI